MAENQNGVLLQQQGLNSQLLNPNTPSIDAAYYEGNGTVVTGYHGRDAQICRYLLNLSFVVAGYLFVSPFVFFVLSFSVVREFGDDHNYSIFHPISQLCDDGSYCFRFIFYAIYLSVFGILFFVMTFLFLYRRDKHPIRARSLRLLSFTVISTFLWVLWSCLGIMYDVSWLYCTGTHVFINICYPMMILPYWFRAYRIKKIFEQASLHENQYGNTMPQLLESTHHMHDHRTRKKKSARSGKNRSGGKRTTSSGKKRRKRNSDSTEVLSTEKQHSSSNVGNVIINHSHNDDISMEISADSHSSITYDSTMTQSAGDLKYLARATEYARALENRLVLYFCLCLLPFVIISVFNVIYQQHFRALPDFSSGCDKDQHVTMAFWMLVHFIEILLLLTTIYLIRLVWRAFSVKQELIWVVVIDVIYCACNLGFGVNNHINRGVLTIYCVLMRCIGLFVISIMRPLYRSYFPISLYIPNADVITSLEAILDDEEATVEFRRFMTDQDSQYLLDCWMEIDLFKDAFASEPEYYNNNIFKGNNEALKIYLKYFDINNRSKAANAIRNIVPAKFCKSMKKIFDKIIVQNEQRELRLKLQSKKKSKKNKKNRNRNKGKITNTSTISNQKQDTRSSQIKSNQSININYKLSSNNNQNQLMDRDLDTSMSHSPVTHSHRFSQMSQHSINNGHASFLQQQPPQPSQAQAAQTQNSNNNNRNNNNLVNTSDPRNHDHVMNRMKLNASSETPISPISPNTPLNPTTPINVGNTSNSNLNGVDETTPGSSLRGDSNVFEEESMSVVRRSRAPLPMRTHTGSTQSYFDSEEENCSIMNEIEFEDLTRVEPIIFDYPQKLVFEHMESLHYRLFLRSEYCKSLLHNLRIQEEIFGHLVGADVL